jgi:hypothetical protein
MINLEIRSNNFAHAAQKAEELNLHASEWHWVPISRIEDAVEVVDMHNPRYVPAPDQASQAILAVAEKEYVRALLDAVYFIRRLDSKKTGEPFDLGYSLALRDATESVLRLKK